MEFAEENELLINYLKDNTIDINYYDNEDTYSLLETHDVTGICSKSRNINLVIKSQFKKITIHDFPDFHCSLFINGTSVATINDGIIDIGKYFNKSSSILYNYMKRTNSKHGYLDGSQIDNMQLSVPKMFAFPENSHYRVIIDTDEGEETHKIYPENTYCLNLSNITDSIDVQVQGTKGEAILYIDDKIVGSQNTDFGIVRFKLRNLEDDYLGFQNRYLSEEINNNTINLSKVKSVRLVLLHCTLKSVKQNMFSTYKKHTRQKLF